MSDINHMEVVPRIVDNSMKITNKQLKNDKKMNESFNKQTQASASMVAPVIKTTKKITESGFFSDNFTKMIILVIIMLVIIIVYMLYLIYKNKNKKLENVKNIPIPVNEQSKIYEDNTPPENYSQYIQPDDEIETMSNKSSGSFNKVDSRFTKIEEETESLEEPETIKEDVETIKEDISESIISNMDMQDMADEIINESEGEDDIIVIDKKVSFIDKLQQDLQN